MTDLFISYSQKDRDRVKPLVDALTAEGYEVWWDLDIRAGESFDQRIEDTLKEVRCVVSVWSRQSVESEWVRAESAWAKDKGKLVSIRIDDDCELPLKFYHVHTLSMTGWSGDQNAPAFQELLPHIGKIAGPAPSTATAHTAATPAAERPRAKAEPAVGHQSGQDPSSTSETVSSIESQTETFSVTSTDSASKPLWSWLRMRGGVVAMASVAAVVIGITFVVFKPADEPDPGGTSGQPRITAIPDTRDSPSATTGGSNTRVDKLEMVTIPAGEFQMGCVTGKGCQNDELPVHGVRFETPFAMSKYEVSFTDYDRYVEATGTRKPSDSGWGRGDRPVIDVDWDDARGYAKWLGTTTGNNCRLPSEAEWEYAARAGTTTRYALPAPVGSYDIAGQGIANCDGCGSEWDNEKTAPARSFKPNQWGLHNMHGNVWEWTEDCWHGDYNGAPEDGGAWLKEGSEACRRVVRGGSWNFNPVNLRSAYRLRITTDYRFNYLGFRVVCSSPISDH